jgi:hypothetical protein
MPKWRYYCNSMSSSFTRWVYKLALDEYHSEFRIYDLHFMKKVNIDGCSNISNYTLDSLLAIREKNGLINQITIPCSYPKDAHHPAIWDLSLYAIYNLYRAGKYLIFKR